MSEPTMAEIELALGLNRPAHVGRARCGQPTKADRPCRNFRMTAGGHEWPTCTVHATAEENAECYAAAIRAQEEADRLLLEFHQSMPVACWSWPVTDEHRQRAADVGACTVQVEAYRAAWWLLVDWQAGRCAICGGRKDFLDHSHQTGMVRGWLCHGCNIGEGFGDYPGGRFERYREKNPASILRLAIRYHSPFTGWAEPEPDRPPELDRSPGYLLATYLADE